jgi:hypothetical protein
MLYTTVLAALLAQQQGLWYVAALSLTTPITAAITAALFVPIALPLVSILSCDFRTLTKGK